MIKSKNFAGWRYEGPLLSPSPKANLLLATLYELLKEDIVWEPPADKWVRVECVGELPLGDRVIVYMGLGNVKGGWTDRDFEDLHFRLSFPVDRLLFYYPALGGKIAELEVDQKEFLEFFERRWGKV